MTEERYNEIDEMSIDQLNKLSNEEYKEYRRLNYLKKTDNTTALNDLKALVSARQQGYTELWPTGFTEFDKKLGGGFMGEQLIMLGAISSLGKTSFALQIATQIAEQGNDVLIFSLEMSKNELNAKTISRYTHIIAEKEKTPSYYKLTTQDILMGNVGDIVFDQGMDAKGQLYVAALDATTKIADHIRIFVGENNVDVDTVRDAVDLHISATGRKPFVIVDYLQILRASDDARTTDKRLLTDNDVTCLKVLSRDFRIPVMVISAFNRTSYLDPVSMGSFRESSGIEYSSDILLGMQYDGMDYKKHWCTQSNGKRKRVFESTQDHNTRVRDLLDQMTILGANPEMPLSIELKILKDRLGVKGTLYLDFQPAYNFFREKSASTYVAPQDYAEADPDATDASSVVSSKKSLGVR